jgi:hypothetical protein
MMRPYPTRGLSTHGGGGKFRNLKPTLIVIISGEFASPSDCHLFTGLTQNHGGCLFKGDDVEIMAGNTGNGVISTGNRKARATI